MSAEKPSGLVRVMGRWSLVALVINSIIGSGIFGLPSVVAALLGTASPLAYLIAAAGVGVLMGCFAEVASQFREAGGPYLYARVAFGRFLGLEVGWLLWLVRLTAAAAAVNLFTTYLAFFWPAAGQPAERRIVAAVVIGTLAAVNIAGVKAGSRIGNLFTVAKLLPLAVFAVAGVLFVAAHPAAAPAARPAATTGDWFEAALLLIFAYGGFEAAMVPMSEARNPRRDAPFALGAALLVVTLLYTLIQVVVVRTLSDPAATDRPLALAAQVFLGGGGATFIAASAMISLYGYLSAQMLHTPRLTFALAERGDFPRWFAAVHSRFRTPYASIIVFGTLQWLLAIAGDFRWNVLLSAVARLFAYGMVCGALLVLRRRSPEAPAYRLPGGRIFAVLGIAFVAALGSQMHRGELEVVAATAGVALLNWLWVRGRARSRALPAGP